MRARPHTLFSLHEAIGGVEDHNRTPWEPNLYDLKKEYCNNNCTNDSYKQEISFNDFFMSHLISCASSDDYI